MEQRVNFIFNTFKYLLLANILFLDDVFKRDGLEKERQINFQGIYSKDQCNIARFLPTYLENYMVDYSPPDDPICRSLINCR